MAGNWRNKGSKNPSASIAYVRTCEIIVRVYTRPGVLEVGDSVELELLEMASKVGRGGREDVGRGDGAHIQLGVVQKALTAIHLGCRGVGGRM